MPSNKTFSIKSLSSKRFRISKPSKEKYISTTIDNRKPSCCMTKLFHSKSIVHIHDEEHRLFSISPLLNSQSDEEILTQKTNACVDQIFDLLMSKSPPYTTNDSCQIELIFPLCTQSQLNKIHTD